MSDSSTVATHRPGGTPSTGASSRDWLTPAIWGGFALLSLLALVLMYPKYRIHVDEKPGNNYFFKENYDKALPHFERLTRKRPKDSIYWQRLGTCQLYVDQPKQALESFQRSKQLNSALGLEEEFGMAYAALGQFQEARPYLENVLKHDPNDVAANYYEGICNLNLGKYQEAARNFSVVVKDDRYDKLAVKYRRQIADAVLGTSTTVSTEMKKPVFPVAGDQPTTH